MDTAPYEAGSGFSPKPPCNRWRRVPPKGAQTSIAKPIVMANDTILSCTAFPQFLVNQAPTFDQLILADIRPTDSWIGNVATGVFPAGSNTSHTLDRFKHVWPNTTKVWTSVSSGSCVGTPCDKTEHCIGWGAERITYGLEEQSWASPLLCYDKDMHVTHAQEHYAQIIADILKPATSAIMSSFLRKRTLQNAGRLLTANATMAAFTYEWTLGGTNADEEIFFDCSVPPTQVFKLVPQMLQRRYQPLMRLGYGGKNPFKETAPFVELITDEDTAWELGHIGGGTGHGGTPAVSDNWRFTQFSEVDKYWKYGFAGQVGNFMYRVDQLGLRFNYIGVQGAAAENAANIYRYQVVLPYVNEVTGGAGGAAGIGSVENPDFDAAQYRISFITHKMGIEALVADATPLNPEMPFSARDFGGRWQFVMDNLGAGPDGCVIENKRRNKGQFIADFKLAIRPKYTEFINVLFHKAEPPCVPEVDTCNADPGYPTQSYDSCNDGCE